MHEIFHIGVFVTHLLFLEQIIQKLYLKFYKKILPFQFYMYGYFLYRFTFQNHQLVFQNFPLMVVYKCPLILRYGFYFLLNQPTNQPIVQLSYLLYQQCLDLYKLSTISLLLSLLLQFPFVVYVHVHDFFY